MSRKRHSVETIVTRLREAEVLAAKGESIPAICRQLGVTENTYYRWRKEGLILVSAFDAVKLDGKSRREFKTLTQVELTRVIGISWL